VSISFETGWYEPYYQGAGVPSAAGRGYPVSLGGVAYEINTNRPGSSTPYDFHHASVAQQRVALDDRENASRGTLNPEAFWRRTFESWHVGAGQATFDRVNDSNPWRFRRSQGVDVWDRYQLSLLNDTDGKYLSANNNLALAVAGTYLYMVDGVAVKYTQDVTADTPTFTNVTGVPATAATSLASDGYSVLTAHSTSGIYKTTRGAATTASHITGTVTHVAYGKGRWLAATGPALYDITTQVAGAGPVVLPAAHFTHPNSDFGWNSFADGPNALYVGGFSGDKSLIYRLTMKDDGTGLNQPVVAGVLPDGEIIRSMQGYLGFVLIGTDAGVRVGVVGSNSELTIGALIPTDMAVHCFEGQGAHVWYGWSGFETTSDCGLGRLSLETFSDPDSLAPAYASDLMVSGLSVGFETKSVVTFQDVRVFAMNGGAAGAVYAENTAQLVAEGQIDSGIVDFGLTDEKLSLYVDSAHAATHDGSHTFALSVDHGTFGSLGSAGEEHHSLATGEARGHDFEIRVTLTRDTVDLAAGPVLTMWALRAQPVAPIIEEIIVPLRIAPHITRSDGVIEKMDPVTQAEHISTLCRTKQVVQYTEGMRAWSVIVADYQTDVHTVWIADDATLGFMGTCQVRLLTVVT
jgi:hypothetical protein